MKILFTHGNNNLGAIGLSAMVCYAATSVCDAQHRDVLLQEVEGQVVTGGADFDTSSWFLGPRVFSTTAEQVTQFGYTYFVSNSPGFNARDEDRPIGSQVLPPSANIDWDFLPMYTAGARSDLLYWSGVGEVDFTVAVDAKLNIAGTNTSETQTLFAQATPNRTVGTTLESTAGDGTLHQHQDFSLFNDGFGIGQPAGDYRPNEGVYVIALEMQVGDLLPADPIFVLLATPGIPGIALDNASLWVEQRVDSLVLEGDYNNNGIVDLADFTLWRDSLNSNASLLANGDDTGDSAGVIDQADYAIWRQHFGRTALPVAELEFSRYPVPEPTAFGLLAGLAMGLLSRNRRAWQ